MHSTWSCDQKIHFVIFGNRNIHDPTNHTTRDWIHIHIFPIIKFLLILTVTCILQSLVTMKRSAQQPQNLKFYQHYYKKKYFVFTKFITSTYFWKSAGKMLARCRYFSRHFPLHSLYEQFPTIFDTESWSLALQFAERHQLIVCCRLKAIKTL